MGLPTPGLLIFLLLFAHTAPGTLPHLLHLAVPQSSPRIPPQNHLLLEANPEPHSSCSCVSQRSPALLPLSGQYCACPFTAVSPPPKTSCSVKNHIFLFLVATRLAQHLASRHNFKKSINLSILQLEVISIDPVTIR